MPKPSVRDDANVTLVGLANSAFMLTASLHENHTWFLYVRLGPQVDLHIQKGMFASIRPAITVFRQRTKAQN